MCLQATCEATGAGRGCREVANICSVSAIFFARDVFGKGTTTKLEIMGSSSRPLVDITTRPQILDAFLENYNRKLESGNDGTALMDAKT